MSDVDTKIEKVSLQLDVAKAKGFDCLICNSGDFSYNAMGLIICSGCGIVYHIHALKEIYK